MKFKHNTARRHRIPKARYRIRKWPAYEAGLKMGCGKPTLVTAAIDPAAGSERGDMGCLNSQSVLRNKTHGSVELVLQQRG